MEEIAHINFDPDVLRDGNIEDRGSGNTERAERRARRNHIGRRHHVSRNGERRRRQQGSSAAIREAAALGGALARAANVRGRQSGHRMRQSSRRRQRQTNELNTSAENPLSTNNENLGSSLLPNMEPSTSSTDLIDDEHSDEYKNTEQSNSSWEDVSEEEDAGSADNSSVTNDITADEGNETIEGGDDPSTCDKS